jgi:hypothetical protein
MPPCCRILLSRTLLSTLMLKLRQFWSPTSLQYVTKSGSCSFANCTTADSTKAHLQSPWGWCTDQRRIRYSKDLHSSILHQWHPNSKPRDRQLPSKHPLKVKKYSFLIVRQPCERCETGRGKFEECRSLKGHWGGCCASCKYYEKAADCELKQDADEKKDE